MLAGKSKRCETEDLTVVAIFRASDTRRRAAPLRLVDVGAGWRVGRLALFRRRRRLRVGEGKTAASVAVLRKPRLGGACGVVRAVDVAGLAVLHRVAVRWHNVKRHGVRLAIADSSVDERLALSRDFLFGIDQHCATRQEH